MLEDDRLSFKAKGLLSYLLSRSDDWDVYQSQLADLGPDGESAVRSGLQELMELGYLNRKKLRKEDGTFKGYMYVIYEHGNASVTGSGKSETGKSNIGESDTGKSQPTNTDRHQHGKHQDGRTAPAHEVGEMFDVIVSVMREVGTLNQRLESRAYNLAKQLSGEYDPKIVQNALREDLDGSLRGWNGEVFKDSVLPEYVNSTTDTKPENAQELRGNGQQVHTRPDDIRTEIR
jgi:hypothetical protein